MTERRWTISILTIPQRERYVEALIELLVAARTTRVADVSIVYNWDSRESPAVIEQRLRRACRGVPIHVTFNTTEPTIAAGRQQQLLGRVDGAQPSPVALGFPDGLRDGRRVAASLARGAGITDAQSCGARGGRALGPHVHALEYDAVDITEETESFWKLVAERYLAYSFGPDISSKSLLSAFLRLVPRLMSEWSRIAEHRDGARPGRRRESWLRRFVTDPWRALQPA